MTGIMRKNAVIGDRYEVVERAGFGGMGDVYKALDTVTGQIAAVKILTSGAAAARKRFEREARALAELRHPSIVHYLDHGVTAEGDPYLVMEWLEGEDLASLLRRKQKLSIDDVLSLALAVAGGLSEAHRFGIIHRDLKPSNLFLEHGSVEQAKIVDFGIVWRPDGTRITGTGTALGTPGYMAPEQARGAPQLSPALDIFSLGGVLFEALAGRPLFEGNNAMAVLARVIFAEIPSIASYRPDTPPELCALLDRMLAKSPERRPADGAALVRELYTLAEVTGPISIRSTQPVLPASLTSLEQRVVSVVLIGASSSTSSEPGAHLPEIRDFAKKLGGRVERLVDGSTAVAFGGGSEIKDLVALAARFAIFARGRMPNVPIAVATGRGASANATTLGHGIEHAAQRMARQGASSDAAPLPVLIDEMTRALLDACFDVQTDMEGLTLLGERAQADIARTLLGKPSPFVGRRLELRVLEEAYQTSVQEPIPRAVLVTAPAGMGKSRLLQEAIDAIFSDAKDNAIWFGRANESLRGSALSVLAEIVRAALEIDACSSPEAQREKIKHRFSSDAGAPSPNAGDRLRRCEFLAEILGVPFPSPGSAQLAAARADGALMSEQTLRAFIDLLRDESKARPVVIVIDDLHCADSASVRFLDAALREIEEQPVFLLGLARPEIHERFPHLWTARGVQELRLGPLSRKASEKLVRSALGELARDEVVERLIVQSEGNAFYLEELIRAVAEGDHALPETIVAMVQARLSRFEPEARRVLRAGSIFGEGFWSGAVASLLGSMPEDEVSRILTLLCDQEVIVRRKGSRFANHEELRFRHALLREGTYATLTEADRRLGHRLAGEWLVCEGETHARSLAEHFEIGGEPSRAAHYYLKAAERSADAGDDSAVLACTERGLCCGAMGESRSALLNLKGTVFLARGHHEETIALAKQAISSAAQGGRQWCLAYHNLFPALIMSHPQDLLERARELHAQPVLPEARSERIRASAWLVGVMLVAGFLALSQELLEQMRTEMTHVKESDVHTWAYFRGAEACHAHVAEEAPWLCVLANTDAARGFEQTGHFRLQALVEAFCGKARSDLGNLDLAEPALRKSLEIAARSREAIALEYGQIYLARVLVQKGESEHLAEAETLAKQVLLGKNASLEGLAHGVLAQLAVLRGDLTSADVESLSAVTLSRPVPAYSWDLIAQRTRILLSLGRPSEARANCEEGLALLSSLGLAGYGEIDLRLAVAETRDKTGNTEGYREMLRETLDRLKRRIRSIPEGEARSMYLENVPANARLIALAREKLGEAFLRELALDA